MDQEGQWGSRWRQYIANTGYQRGNYTIKQILAILKNVLLAVRTVWHEQFVIWLNLFACSNNILPCIFCKPRKEDLTKACNALGVSASGSQSKPLNRLEELLYNDVYPKMFVKLHKAGGKMKHWNIQYLSDITIYDLKLEYIYIFININKPVIIDFQSWTH